MTAPQTQSAPPSRPATNGTISHSIVWSALLIGMLPVVFLALSAVLKVTQNDIDVNAKGIIFAVIVSSGFVCLTITLVGIGIITAINRRRP